MDSAAHSTIRKPLIEHIHELRIRLLWVVLMIIVASGISFYFHKILLNLLQQPLGQTLYYTSPTGGLTFLFKLCAVSGSIIALPLIIYNLFRFLVPVLEPHKQQGLFKYVIWSFLLAYGGVAFAYFISLPAALHFLTSFADKQIQSLINVNEYFNFAIAYVGGFALLFQIPLIILFINRLTPLPPRKMISSMRYIIVGSFIVAAILTPTPDPINQFIMAAPIIVLYILSIFLVWITRPRNKLVREYRKAAKYIDLANLHTVTEQQACGVREASSSGVPTIVSHTKKIPIMDIIPPAKPIYAQPRRPVARRPVLTTRTTMFDPAYRSLVGNEI
jgi:sec-independent protein translocase protein TatC